MQHQSFAVAAASANSSEHGASPVFVSLSRDAAAPQWIPAPENTDPENGAWSYDLKTNLHPYWHVERLTEKEAFDRHVNINCKTEEVAFTSIQFGVVYGDSLSAPCEVCLPIITNTQVIAKNERLYLSKVASKREQKQKTWKETERSALNAEAKKNQKSTEKKTKTTAGDNRGTKRKLEAEEI